MTKLELLLQKYEDKCFSHEMESSKYTFDTKEQRFLFVRRLNNLNVEYMLHETGDCLFNIEVFLK